MQTQQKNYRADTNQLQHSLDSNFQNKLKKKSYHYKNGEDFESESADSSSDFQQVVKIRDRTQMNRNFDVLQILLNSKQTRPKRNLSERNYRFDDEKFDQIVAEEAHQGKKSAEDQEIEEPEYQGVFHPEISQILWRRQNENEGQNEYLVKFKNRSYLHVKWLLEDEKLNRFNKIFDKRLIEDDLDLVHENLFFDQAFTEPDRILATTDIFPIVHPKKGNELKGKTGEWLQQCALKLLNFTMNGVKYGVYFMEPVDPKKDGCPSYKRVVSQPMDFGTIINRVYLGFYQDYTSYWNDVGLVFRNCRRFNINPNSDIRRLCDTLRECAIVLYKNWYNLMLEKYNQNTQKGRQAVDDTKKKNALINTQQKKIKNFVTKWYQDQNINQNIEQEQKQENDFIQTNQVEQEELRDESELKDQLIINQITLTDYLKENLEIDINFDYSNEDILDTLLNKVNQAILIQGLQINVSDLEVERTLREEQRNELTQEEREIEYWHPGQFQFKWLQDDRNSNEDFQNYQYQYITEKQISKNLKIETEVDRLFMVKWKNLSYSEATWEKESNICDNSKILEFKQFNRSLDKDSRVLMQQQSQRHRNILDQELGIKKKKFTFQALQEMRNALYFYNKGRNIHQYVPSTQPVFKDRKLLRDYQLQSLNWLIQAWYEDRNVILADEMGLGKTVQTVAFLNHLHSLEGCRGPFLVVAPLSTLGHWKRTVEDWTNMNSVLYYDQEGADGRAVCRYYDFFYTDISTKGVLLHQQQIVKFQIMITSYEVFLMDVNIMLDLAFQYVVIDEAHRLKNQNARILQALKRLPCKRTLLLTGTPVQNNTDELFSLLNFIEPKQFDNLGTFRTDFGDLTSSEQIDRLNILLKPYILRRQKEDVEQQIPPLQETIIDIEMTTIQKTLYKALYERNKNMLLQGFSQNAASATQLNNLEIQLRKCCNHPFLIKEMHSELTRDCNTLEKYYQVLVDSSGKMILLEKLLTRFRDEGRKVLIFSQFVYMLGLIEEYLKWKQIKFEKIDGQIKAKDRQNSIDRFNDPNMKRDVFLLSTKAGGQGINLTAAEVVIIFDSDWNPQNDVQATARAHRIGQSKEVTVYRLVTKNTYEAEMFERATRKLGLDQAIFMSGTFKRTDEVLVQDKKLSKHEVETLLRKGILGLVQNEQIQNDVLNENLEAILDHNSRTAKYSLINGTYTIQKSSFVSENADQSLKIEDPNFWQIILKNSESRTLKLLRSIQQADKDMTTFNEQKKYMLELADSVNILVESKLSHQGYSTDDEINILNILEIIQFSDLFSKKLKDTASNWFDEIKKPTRRFKKITAADLEGTIDSVPQSSQQDKSSRIFKPNNTLPQPLVQQYNQDDISFNEREDAKRLALKSRDELLKKICQVCEKSKCSQFCWGFCRRAFHECCSKYLEQDTTWVNNEGPPQQWVSQNIPWELSAPEISIQLNIKYHCPDCAQNVVICQICKKRGAFYPNDLPAKNNTTVKSKSKKQIDENIEEEYNDDNDAYIENNSPSDYNAIEEEYEKQNKVKLIPRKRTSKPQSELSKCSTANCSRYFHLECIKNHPHAKMLEQSDKLFRCPAHVCCYCLASSSHTSAALVHCVRCCRSFHIKCAPNETKNKLGKVTKKLMLCDNCNKNTKSNETIIKLQLEPTSSKTTNNIKNFKQCKLSIKFEGSIMRIQKQAPPLTLSLPPQQESNIEESHTAGGYKNLRKRRNKPFGRSPSESPEPVQIPIRRKTVVVKKKQELSTLTYEELGIPPIIDFDYTSYPRDWCRYCGARFASNFTKGPWGSRTLCTIHYINWGQKKTLDLSKYPELPTSPINKEDQTELQFIQREKLKKENFNPKQELDAFINL